MVGKDPSAFPPEREQDLRRSRRFSLIIPVKVKWKTERGPVYREEAKAIEVNAHGAMLRMKARPLKHKDTSTVLSLLTTERIRRAAQLADATVADMDARQLIPESPVFLDLVRAMGRLNRRLRTTLDEQDGT
jgi:hypothetical protein